MHRTEGPVVVGNVGADGGLHGERGVGVGVVEDHVDAAGALRRGTGEVDENVLVFDGYGRSDQDGFLETVAPGFMPMNPVGDLADGLPHRLLGAGDYLIRKRIYGVEVELIHEAQQRPGPHIVAGGLGVKVAYGFVGRPHVGPDDRDQVLVDFALVVELHNRDSQPFLVHLPGLGGEDSSPDVGGVTGVGEIGHLAAVFEDRRHYRYVVDLAGGHPRIVGYQNIAWLERTGWILVEEMAQSGGHGVDVAGGAGERLGHHPAVGVEHPAGQILGLPHDGAEGGALQGHLLLVDDRQHPAPEHLDQNRIQSGGHVPPPKVTTILSLSSTRTRPPLPMTAVDSRSSMMAGPVREEPGTRR